MDVYCVAAYQYNNYNFSLIPMSILLLLLVRSSSNIAFSSSPPVLAPCVCQYTGHTIALKCQTKP